jgi:hypothetical protein
MNRRVLSILVAVVGMVLVRVQSTGQCFLTILKEPPTEKWIDQWYHPVSMSVEAQGTPPIYYQWYRGEIPIAGATNACYQTPPIPALLADNLPLYFWVEVSNVCERIHSCEVSLYFRWDPNPRIEAAAGSATNKVLVLFGSPILAESATNFYVSQGVCAAAESARHPGVESMRGSQWAPGRDSSHGFSASLV